MCSLKISRIARATRIYVNRNSCIHGNSIHTVNPRSLSLLALLASAPLNRYIFSPRERYHGLRLIFPIRCARDASGAQSERRPTRRSNDVMPINLIAHTACLPRAVGGARARFSTGSM